MRNTFVHDRNFGESINKANAASGGVGWNQSLGWISNESYYVVQQYLQHIGQVQFGRITEVYTSSKTVEVSFTGGRGTAPYGMASFYQAGGSLETPSPGDLCIVWIPPNGQVALLAHWAPPGDSKASPYDVEYVGISSVSEERHALALDETNASVMRYHNAGRPYDLLCGDWGHVTAAGVTLALLGEVALLKATPLAQIQFNVLDDSVRLISRTYEHWFVGGSSAIYVDRDQVNAEWMLTKSLAQALGVDELGSDITTPGSDAEFFEVHSNPEALPKERLQFHAGHNADLVHVFSVKPVTGTHSLPSTEAPAGVAEGYIGSDGAVSIRSAKSLSFSKVAKIRVPKRKLKPWDAERTLSRSAPAFSYDPEHVEGRHLATPDDIAYRRDTKEVSNFLDRNDHHALPPTSEATSPVAEDGETPYTTREATLEFRDDGSVIVFNDSGSSIELTPGGDIRVHAARDLSFEAGRHVRFFAGGDITQRARKTVELISSHEDVRLKAQKNLHAVAVDQGVVIETFSSGVPTLGVDAPESSLAGLTLRSNKGSPVYIEATEDKILLSSQKETALRVLSPDDKFYVEAGHAQINLTRGPELLEIGATDMKVNLDGTHELVAANSMIELSGNWALLTAGSTSISTFGLASWFHPFGVEVAHRHPLNEWTHKADSDGSLLGHGILIEKRTSPVLPATKPFEPSSYEEEAAPHTPDVMTNAAVGFRDEAKYPKDRWYQTLWQQVLKNAGLGITWDLSKEDVLNSPSGPSSPYPGRLFDERFSYSAGAASMAGPYLMQPLSEYLVIGD